LANRPSNKKIAAVHIIEMNGGLTAVCDRQISAELPLPTAGLMSDKLLEKVRSQMDAMINAALAMGASIADPFMILSFLALPVIPELKLTDRGLFDVNQFAHVFLFVD
jgi:adenine deaminase